MSHIFIDENKFKELNYIFNFFENESSQKDIIQYVLENYIVKNEFNENYVEYVIYENNSFLPSFNSSKELIEIPLAGLKRAILQIMRLFVKAAKVLDIEVELEELKKYILIFILFHEIEHSNQYLISKGRVDSPCLMVQKAYDELFNLSPVRGNCSLGKLRNIFSLILFKMNAVSYCLERNANVEALGIIEELAYFNMQDNIGELFGRMYLSCLKDGYRNKYNGVIEETFIRILRRDFFRPEFYNFNLGIEESIRYGLPIDDEIKKELINTSYNKY